MEIIAAFMITIAIALAETFIEKKLDRIIELMEEDAGRKEVEESIRTYGR